MAIPDYRATLAHLPSVLALWERMLKLSREYPGLVFAGVKPMIIDPYGKPAKNPARHVSFAIGEIQDFSGSIWSELILLERLLRQQDISTEEREAICKNAEYALPFIDNAEAEVQPAYITYLAHAQGKN